MVNVYACSVLASHFFIHILWELKNQKAQFHEHTWLLNEARRPGNETRCVCYT